MKLWSDLKKAMKHRRRPLLRWVADGLKHVWYWVRCHTYNRYHVLNLSGEDGYDWGWYDADHRMLLACFKLLREFVEQEDLTVGLRTLDDYCDHDNGAEHCAWLHPGLLDQIKVERRVRELYVWWTETRPLKHELSDGSDTIELYEEDQKHLHQLMAVRGSLWT